MRFNKISSVIFDNTCCYVYGNDFNSRFEGSTPPNPHTYLVYNDLYPDQLTTTGVLDRFVSLEK